MSLAPLEMLAAGCTPVSNSGAYTKVSYSKNVVYAEPLNPDQLANALAKAVKQYNPNHAQKVSTTLHQYSWDVSNARIEQLLINDFK